MQKVEQKNISREPLKMVETKQSLLSRLAEVSISPSIVNPMVVVIDQVFYSAASFITGAMVARQCSEGQYGAFFMGFTIVQVAQQLHRVLVTLPYTFLHHGRSQNSQRAFHEITAVHLIITLGITGVLFAVWIIAKSFIRTSNINVIILVIITVNGILMRDFVRYTFLADMRVWANLLLGLVSNIALMIVFLWEYYYGFLTLRTAFIITGMTTAVAAAVFLLPNLRPSLVFKIKIRHIFYSNWAFGKWLILDGITSAIVQQSYTWILGFTGGAKDVAPYGVGMSISRFANPLVVGTANYLAPKTAELANGDRDTFRKVVMRSSYYMGLMMLLVVGLGLIFGEKAIILVYGSKYEGLGKLLSICIISTSIGAIGVPISISLNAIGKPNMRLMGSLVGAIPILVIGLPIVVGFGPVGAALGLGISNLLTIYMWYFLLCKNTGIANLSDD